MTMGLHLGLTLGRGGGHDAPVGNPPLGNSWVVDGNGNYVKDGNGDFTYAPTAPSAVVITWATGFEGGVVPEDTASGTTIATLSATDADLPNDAHTFALTADPDSKFLVTGSSLKLNAALDYGTATSHAFTIEATDAMALTVSTSGAGITVGDVYAANAVTFDGTNDYMRRTADFTGLSDGKAGVVSAWLKPASDGVNCNIIFSTNQRLYLGRTTGNALEIQCRNAANTLILRKITTATNFTAANGWKHILASWDLATSTFQLYVTDVEITAFGTNTLTNDTIDYTSGDVYVGATASAATRLNGDLADVFFHPTYLDLSVAANRRKFIRASGKPENLGADGSTPLGVQPILFLSGAVASWHTNKGSGGGMTLTGALTAAATSPSD